MLSLCSRLILPAAVTATLAAATPVPHTYSVAPAACWNTAVWQSVWIVKRVCRPDAPAPAPAPQQLPRLPLKRPTRTPPNRRRDLCGHRFTDSGCPADAAGSTANWSTWQRHWPHGHALKKNPDRLETAGAGMRDG